MTEHEADDLSDVSGVLLFNDGLAHEPYLWTKAWPPNEVFMCLNPLDSQYTMHSREALADYGLELVACKAIVQRYVPVTDRDDDGTAFLTVGCQDPSHHVTITCPVLVMVLDMDWEYNREPS